MLSACGENNSVPPETHDQSVTGQSRTDRTLISRADLFGEPVQFQGRISPDGAKVSWLGLRDGALNLFVADADNTTPPRQYTFGKDGVETHRWTPNSAYILYTRSFAETKTTQVFALNVQTGKVRNVAPTKAGDSAWLKDVSKNWPNSALISLRRKGEKRPALYRVDLVNAQTALVANNPEYTYWVTDSDFVPRIGIKNNSDGGQTWVAMREGGNNLPLFSVDPKHVQSTRPQQIDATSTNLYLIDGREKPFSALARIDLQTGERQVLAKGLDGDIAETLFHPITAEPLAYFTNGTLPKWHAFSADFQGILDRLEDTLGPRFFILAATNTAQQLVVYSDRPDHPGIYSLYDLDEDKISTLFETMPGLAQYTLAPSDLVKIKARDGFELITYFTRAQGDNPGAAPLVLIPQPMINSRMRYGFDSRVQWLSNRGYNVLEVNTRGASQLGQAYQQAGQGRGILRAKEDLEDAANAITQKGLADKNRIAGVSWINGARTILNFAAINNSPLRCVVALNPVIDVANILANVTDTKIARTFRNWLDSDGTAPDEALIREISPIYHAQDVKARVLILQNTANEVLDPNLTRNYVKAIRKAGGDAAMVYFPEFGKAFFEKGETLPNIALSEAFLAECLGGKAEPIGDTLDEITFEVNAGPGGIPGIDLQ